MFFLAGMTTTNSTKSGRLSATGFSLAVGAFLLVTVYFCCPIRFGDSSSRASACVMHLRTIDGAKATWALENKKLPTDTPTDADLFGPTNYIREKPACPRFGKYTLGKVGEKARCSVAGHTY